MHEAELELRMLGGLDVRRGGKSLALPPSKKTRALLAYLALTGRAHRREALCGLLWDVTDDPRGALRWSLSKLRKQVDDEQLTRLQTEGERVELGLSGIFVDVLEMRVAFAGGKLETAGTPQLESWCDRCVGEVLEGLDLPDFDGYQAWLVAEREQTRRLHASLREELVRRHESAPERASSHATAWVRVDPMSAQARLAAMRLAMRMGQLDEAKRQLSVARRLFSELDPAKEAQLLAGWAALSERPARADRELPQPSAPDATPGKFSEPSATAARRRPSAPSAPAPARSVEAPRAPLTAAPPLIGRDEEHAQLTAACSRVRRSQRAEIVLLTGEPGIGKSRLLDEILSESRAGGSAVLDGAAFEGETGRPYGPWIDALRKLSRADIDEATRTKLAPLLERPDTRASSRESLFSAVVDVLTELAAAHAPVLVVLDDVHWLDEGSAELLHYTARMQRDQPVLFVLAAREAELHDQPNVLRVLRSLRRDLELHEIALTCLSEQATRALVAKVDDAADAARVFANSGGNPLFALELARAGATAERARTVAEAVRDRVARLSQEAGETLRWAAVLGSAIDPQLLAALSSLTAEQRLDGLEQLQRHALLRLETGPLYSFSHDVVRGIVYSDLSQPRRTLMHQRAAEALERLQEQSHTFDEAAVADIARHAALGEGHALAARAYVAAGQRCLKLFASENAAAMARKGIRHARELAEPARSRTLLELYDVQLWAKRPQDQTEFCTTVQALAETALEHGSIEHARLGFTMLGNVRWEHGDWDEARRQILKAEQVVRSGEGSDHIEALAEAALCLAKLERDLSHAEAMLAEANARAKPLAYTSSALSAAEGLLRLQKGEVDAADALLESARSQARAGSQRYVETQLLIHRVQLHVDLGHWELALELALETQQLADKTRDGSEGPYARVLVALARLPLGRAEPAELDTAFAELRAADAKHCMTFGLTRAAALFNAREQPSRAAAMAEEALVYARVLERPSDTVLALAELAKARRSLGDAPGFEASRNQLRAIPSIHLSAYARDAHAAFREE
jgi:DNA-binding SARP family transcriptional activator